MDKTNINLFGLKKASIRNRNLILKYKYDTIVNGNDIDNSERKRIKDYITTSINEHILDYQLIVSGKKIIGVLCFYKVNNDYLLDEIYLIDNYRGLGIGSKIIKELQNKVKTSHEKIYLWVYKTNEKALNLYNYLGFRIVEQTVNRYKMVCD